MKELKAAVLVLADGTVFEGVSVGHEGHVCGEVVFNTSQVGYQEMLTDPSYAQQILVFTQPHIGNVGVNVEDMEAKQVFLQGVVMRSFSHSASNWRAQDTLQNFLQQHKITAISDIDTRALTQHLRQHGSQNGCIMTAQGDETIDNKKAQQLAREFPSLLGLDLAKEVSTKKPYTWDANNKTYNIVVYDFGVKQSILNCLANVGCNITVVPAQTTAQEVLALKPDGIVLSNGPGDPAACTYAIAAIQELLKANIPIMAICLGHQLLALATGAKTQKMKYGHHGANHPVQNLKNGDVAISSQNHGFVVADNNLPSCLRVTYRSLFDGSIAGIEHTTAPAFGFQGHPEAGPGPIELTSLFKHFISLMQVAHAKKN